MCLFIRTVSHKPRSASPISVRLPYVHKTNSPTRTRASVSLPRVHQGTRHLGTTHAPAPASAHLSFSPMREYSSIDILSSMHNHASNLHKTTFPTCMRIDGCVCSGSPSPRCRLDEVTQRQATQYWTETRHGTARHGTARHGTETRD